MLNADEVAQMLSLSRNTVYDMIRRGDLPGFRIRHSVRVPERRLAEYMRIHRLRPQVPRSAGQTKGRST
jgi:excisionase family DNA binding protein